MQFFFVFFASSSHANETLSRVHYDDGSLKSYEQLLNDNKLAGISVAVVDNYNTIFTYAGGLKNFGTKDKVDIETSFNAASISKPVVATIALMLSEQNRLDLDAPVNDYLKKWKTPESAFTKSKSITFRHLLTHTAGTSHSGYGSKYLGDPIPSTVDTLNTYKNKKISIAFEPGSSWKYSGGGFLIAQLALEDITGKSIAKLSEEMLFRPLGMKSTVFNQHGDPEFPINIAKAHDKNREVISTGIPICSEAACGLWTSATDMAKYAIEIQKALSGENTKVISAKVAQMLVEIQTTQLSGGLIMATVDHGRGIFIFGNGAYQARVSTIDQIVASVVNTMGWRNKIRSSADTPSKDLIELIVGDYENLTPNHFSPFAKRVRIEKQGSALFLLNSTNKATPLPLIHVGKNKFKVDQLVNSQIGFVVDDKEDVYLTLEQAGTKLVSKALHKLIQK